MMSGEGDDVNSFDWMWAHVLCQKKGLRMEEYATMERNVRLAYIASEELAIKAPLNADERLARGILKKK